MRALILIVAVFLVAPPVWADFKGQCDDSVRLGDARWPELKGLMREVRELVKADELPAAIDVQRQIVRLQCHNHYQRYYLAELLVRLGELVKAIEVLDGLYALGVNDLEVRLFNPKNRLHPIASSDAFRSSSLAREIESKRAAHQARQQRFLAALKTLSDRERAPSPFIAKDVCPFECCQYGPWSVLADIRIVAAPGSNETVGVARKGTQVEGLTGDVHLTPLPVAVVHAEEAHHPPATVEAGELVFLLDEMGEGFFHVWHRGVVHTMAAAGDVRDHCPFPDGDCWGEFLESRKERVDPVWWKRIRLSDGTVGWTTEDHFGDMGGCG